MAKHDPNNLEKSEHQAEKVFQASIIQYPYRKKSSKVELPGSVFRTRKKRWNHDGNAG